jgi:predicted transglutaminase-like cysteine proteinase
MGSFGDFGGTSSARFKLPLSSRFPYPLEAYRDGPVYERFAHYNPSQVYVGEPEWRHLTPQLEKQLINVTRMVNDRIDFKNDIISEWLIHDVENHAYRTNSGPPRVRRTRYRTFEGDCDDHAVTKRAVLNKHGWSLASLWPLSVIADGDGHMVLLVLTDRGDYILDNYYREDDVLPWSQYPYQWTTSIG